MSNHMTIPDALRACYEGQGFTQAEVVTKMEGISSARLSTYVTGKVNPPLEIIASVEEVVGRPKGWVLAAAGFVENFAPTFEAAVNADLELDPQARRVLLAMRDAAVTTYRKGRS